MPSGLRRCTRRYRGQLKIFPDRARLPSAISAIPNVPPPGSRLLVEIFWRPMLSISAPLGFFSSQPFTSFSTLPCCWAIPQTSPGRPVFLCPPETVHCVQQHFPKGCTHHDEVFFSSFSILFTFCCKISTSYFFQIANMPIAHINILDVDSMQGLAVS